MCTARARTHTRPLSRSSSQTLCVLSIVGVAALADPVMFADYLREFHPVLRLDGAPRYALSATMLGAVTALNVAGVDCVANISTLFTLLVISPFVALVLWGVPSLDTSAWLVGPTSAAWLAAGKRLRPGTFLSVLLWNTSGYDSVGALAAEVADPGRNFPVAMVASIVLISMLEISPSLSHHGLKVAGWSTVRALSGRKVG